MKLKVRLERWKDTLIFQVLEQNDIISNREFSDGEYSVISRLNPDIRRYGIYLRGKDVSEDNKISMYKYDSESDAKCAFEAFNALVDRINTEVVVKYKVGDKFEIETRSTMITHIEGGCYYDGKGACYTPEQFEKTWGKFKKEEV